MDDGLLNKPNDDQPKADETQSKVDEVLNSLPADLEKPIEKPVEPVATPVTSVEEPKPEVPEVKVEKPEKITPPKRKTGKAVKIIGGFLLLALLVGGGWYGMKMMEYQQVVNSQAWKDKQTKVVGRTIYTYDEKKGKVVTSKMDPADWAKLNAAKEAGTLDDEYINEKGNIGWDSTKVDSSNTDTTQTVNTTNVSAVAQNQGRVLNIVKTMFGGGEITYDRFSSTLPTLSKIGLSKKEAVRYVSYHNTNINANYTFDDNAICEFWEGSDVNGDGMIDNSDEGVKWSKVNCNDWLKKLKAGEICGQLDYGGSSKPTHWYVYSEPSCYEPEPEEESPDPSTPPSSPTPTYSCAGLTGDAVYEYGATETFSCEANFSAVNPVAFFRYNVDSGAYNTSPAVALSGTTASYDIPIDQYGTWEVQCRICTDSTATSCTAWGQAN